MVPYGALSWLSWLLGLGQAEVKSCGGCFKVIS